MVLNFQVHDGLRSSDWSLVKSRSLLERDLLGNQLVLKGVQGDVRVTSGREIRVVLVAKAAISAIVHWTARVG